MKMVPDIDAAGRSVRACGDRLTRPENCCRGHEEAGDGLKH